MPAAKEYKDKIRDIAKKIIDHPLTNPVDIKIYYFHSINRRMDMDNVAKCIMDALNGLAYQDDRIVREQTSRSYDLRKHLRIHDTVDIIKPLMKYSDYVFVRISEL